MVNEMKKSSIGLKLFLASTSLTGVIGLWVTFSNQTLNTGSSQNTPVPVYSGEIFMPELPTLVPPVNTGNINTTSGVADAAQNLRSASAPAQVQVTQPPLRVEQIIVGNSSGNGGSTSNTGTTSGGGSASSTTTQSSR